LGLRKCVLDNPSDCFVVHRRVPDALEAEAVSCNETDPALLTHRVFRVGFHRILSVVVPAGVAPRAGTDAVADVEAEFRRRPLRHREMVAGHFIAGEPAFAVEAQVRVPRRVVCRSGTPSVGGNTRASVAGGVGPWTSLTRHCLTLYPSPSGSPDRPGPRCRVGRIRPSRTWSGRGGGTIPSRPPAVSRCDPTPSPPLQLPAAAYHGRGGTRTGERPAAAPPGRCVASPGPARPATKSRVAWRGKSDGNSE
jgi:hypothetical protein